MRNQNFGVHFLANLSIDLGDIQNIATTCYFVEAHAFWLVGWFLLFCFSFFGGGGGWGWGGGGEGGAHVVFKRERESSAGVILLNMRLTSSCIGTREPICFKLGILLNTSKHCSLISV